MLRSGGFFWQETPRASGVWMDAKEAYCWGVLTGLRGAVIRISLARFSKCPMRRLRLVWVKRRCALSLDMRV